LDSPQAGPVGSASYDRDAEFRLRAGLWLLLTTQLSVLLYGRIRVASLGRDQLWAHLIGIPFTFILPLVLAALTTRAKPPDDET